MLPKILYLYIMFSLLKCYLFLIKFFAPKALILFLMTIFHPLSK